MLLSAGNVSVAEILFEHIADAGAACDAQPPVMRAVKVMQRCLVWLMSDDVVYGAVCCLQAVWLW